MSDSGSSPPTRNGAYRDIALAKYGPQCQNDDCGWTPPTDLQMHKLHVHHLTPRSEGGSDDDHNLTVLCRDCHLAEHSDTAFSHELVGRLTNTLADAVTHKTDGFAARVSRRVRLDSVTELDGLPPANAVEDAREGDDFALVEGLMNGDHYDEYFVSLDRPYLQRCSCYLHSGGGSRALNICTHVGATVVRRAIEVARDEGEEAALAHIRDVGERLNAEAEDYLETQELVTETIDTLDIADRFSEGWADRARRQAKKVTRYGREWKAFGGECEGCEIRLTADGFRCTGACDQSWGREDKWPCPGKLAAYIHNESGDDAVAPAFDEGQLFEVKREFAPAAEVEDTLVAATIDAESQTVTFAPIDRDADPFKVEYGTVTDAILANDLVAASDTDALGWGLRLVTTPDATGDAFVAPDIDDLVMQVDEDASFHPRLDPGDYLYVVDHDDSTRTLRVNRIGSDEGVDLEYAAVTDALREYALTKAETGDLTGWGLRLVTTEAGVPRFVAPDLDEGMVMHVGAAFHSALDVDEFVYIVGQDDSSRELYVERMQADGERVAIDYATAVDAIRDYDLTKNWPSDTDLVMLAEVVGAGDDAEVVIKSPYAAKDDIKALDRGETGRYWNPDRNAWQVDADALSTTVHHLDDCGWDVYVMPAVREHDATHTVSS